MEPSQPLSSSFLAQKFIDFATQGTDEFKGKPGFSDKVKENIRAAAELKVGRSLLQELLDTGRTITIVEGKNDDLDLIGGNFLNPSLQVVSLNFDKKSFYVSVHESGERQLVEHHLATLLIHELTHVKHMNLDTQAMVRRVHVSSSNPEMHNQEEELTITGCVVGSDEKDPCNENAALSELKLPLKVDHWLFCQESPFEALQEIIFSRAIGSLRKMLASPDGQTVAVTSGDELLIQAVQMMLDSKTPTLITEYATIINLLISQGCKSERALAILLQHQNQECLKLAQLLLKAGCKSDDALESVMQVLRQVADLKMQEEYFKITQQLVTSGCKSNRALDTASSLASLEADPLKLKEWFAIIGPLIQSGCQSPGVLKNIAGIILKIDDPKLQKPWVDAISPLIDHSLNKFESKIVEEFSENMKKLIGAEYAAIVLELFETVHEFLPEKDREFLKRRSQKLQAPLKIIHELIEEECRVEDIPKILTRLCSNLSPINKFNFLDSLIRGTLYIAICEKTFIKGQSAENAGLPQFKRMKEACDSIIRYHESKEKINKEISEENTKLITDLCLIKERYR